MSSASWGGGSDLQTSSSHLSRCIQRYQALGVARVEERVTAPQLRALMQTFKVVILLLTILKKQAVISTSSYGESKINPESFFELVPTEFTGVIDLSVLVQVSSLISSIVGSHVCTVGYSDKPVKPTLWAEIYGVRV